MRSINHIVTDNIQSRLPEGISVAKYLQEKLILGKEAAYRRVRNQVPYTFEEVISIAADLRFSLDSILEQAEYEQISDSVLFKMPVDLTKSCPALFVEMFQRASEIMQQLFESKDSTIYCALNRIPFQWFLFPTLLKFEYSRFLHGRGELPLNARFSEVQVPPEALKWQQKTAYYFYRLPHISCVVDSTIFQKTIDEITYFYRRKFLSREELLRLQEELTLFLNTLVRHFFAGRNDFGTAFDFYYSQLPIDANCLYLKYDETEMAQIYVYFENPIAITNNPTITQLQKRWIESRMRYATQISRTNDLFSSNLYERLQHLAESLGEIDPSSQDTLS